MQKTHKKQNSPRKAVSHKGKLLWKKFLEACRKAYHSVMAILTIALCGVLCLSAYSDLISPLWWVHPSFLGIGFGVLLILALLWAFILLLLVRKRCLMVMGVTLILIIFPLLRYCPLHLFGGHSPVTHVEGLDGSKRSIPVDSIRLLTYNTCAMGQTHLSKLKEPIPVMDFIRESGADIVCLQEYAFTLSKGGHTQDQLRSMLNKQYPYYDYTPNDKRTAMGIALFSKYPIRKALRVDRRKKGYFSCMYYQLEVQGRLIGLINMHLHTNSIKPKDRVLYDEMIDHFEPDSIGRIRSGILRSVSNAFRQRAAESAQIVQFLQENHPEGMPLLICGDMNDTPISHCYHTIRQGLSDTWQEAGLGYGITYKEHHFWFRIDHIFHSPQFRALDVSVRKDIPYSDHYPVEAVFQLLPEI